MRSGFNTDVPLGGRTYHVQTEDCALNAPVVRTFLYLDGEILASKEVDYSPLLARPDSDRNIKKLMVFQHRLIIDELLSGMHAQGPEGPGKSGLGIKDRAVGK